MKTNRLALAAVILTACLSGCASVERALNNLPQISAAEIHLSQGNPLTSIQIDAVNLQQTPTQATADSLTVQVSGTFTGTTSVSFKGYVRDKRVPIIAEPKPGG